MDILDTAKGDVRLEAVEVEAGCFELFGFVIEQFRLRLCKKDPRRSAKVAKFSDRDLRFQRYDGGKLCFDRLCILTLPKKDPGQMQVLLLNPFPLYDVFEVLFDGLVIVEYDGGSDEESHAVIIAKVVSWI